MTLCQDVEAWHDQAQLSATRAVKSVLVSYPYVRMISAQNEIRDFKKP